MTTANAITNPSNKARLALTGLDGLIANKTDKYIRNVAKPTSIPLNDQKTKG